MAIVGAGPAGTSLAIRLAEQDFPVVLIEREKFPRHKLCGEFISPECLPHFESLGVLDTMLSRGGDHITETRFYEPGGRHVIVPSKWFGQQGYALSLSRAEMDLRLLARARSVGVEVLEETAVVDVFGSSDEINAVKTRDRNGGTSEVSADLFIDATGRSRILSKLIEKKTRNGQLKRKAAKPILVGFKTHLRNVNLEKGRCEIYFFRGGYGGLSCVENGLANHCFLARAKTVREFNGNTDKLVEEVIFKNKRAALTLKDAVPVREWLAVSIDSFGIKELNPAANLFSVGDSAAFIDPFTGSGMLMAFESSQILADCVAEYGFAFEKIAGQYQKQYKLRFTRRLRICSLLRRAAFVPHLAKLAISALRLSESSRQFLVRSTRPQPDSN